MLALKEVLTRILHDWPLPSASTVEHETVSLSILKCCLMSTLMNLYILVMVKVLSIFRFLLRRNNCDILKVNHITHGRYSDKESFWRNR